MYILPKGASFTSTKAIGTKIGKLYKLDFQPMEAPVSSEGSEERLCEHLHRRRAHMHQGALQVLREIVAGLPHFSADQQEVCRRCALGERTKAEWIDRDSQAPDSQQDLAEGAGLQVVGGSSTVTAETPGSGESQVTGSGTQGTGTSPVLGAGAQVTGQGT